MALQKVEALEKRVAELECFRGLVRSEEDEPEVEVTEEDVMATHRMWAERLLRVALGYEWPWPSDGAIDRLARYLREQGIQIPPESVTEEVER
jgi:hypothetical protein